ncbi:hypothetical protein BH24ACT4_BH24ACT4_06000 [soil metagenome]
MADTDAPRDRAGFSLTLTDADDDCDLDLDARPARLDEWRGRLAQVTDRSPIDGGTRLTLGPDADLAEAARLMAAEQGCCSFFAFALTVDDRGTALEVRAPADAFDAVDLLLGAG